VSSEEPPRQPNNADTRNSDPSPAESAGETPHPTLDPLPKGLRYALFVVGAILVAIGLIGLALPVVPQVIPLVLGAAVLSLASDGLHRAVQRALGPWPGIARRFREVRVRIHRLVSRSRKP
jgi:hypothetical protein